MGSSGFDLVGFWQAIHTYLKVDVRPDNPTDPQRPSIAITVPDIAPKAPGFPLIRFMDIRVEGRPLGSFSFTLYLNPDESMTRYHPVDARDMADLTRVRVHATLDR